MFGFTSNFQETRNDHSEDKRVLDASQLPRLVNLRAAKAEECSCERCGDLLDNLKMKTGMLEQYHQAETPALDFWKHPHESGSAHFESQLDKKMKLDPKELTRHDEFIDSLVEVEHAWQRSQKNTCVNEDTDDFWLKHYLELKRIVSEQREREEEVSLSGLRAEVLEETTDADSCFTAS